MVSPQQRRRLVFVGSLLIGAALACAEAPPSLPSAEARARDDSLRLGLLSTLEPLLGAVPADPSCDPSSSDCPTLVSISPGYVQGRDQPNPIEITFSGPVTYIGLTPAYSGSRSLYCLGTFGTAVAYGAEGTELGRVDLQLIEPSDCGSDNVTFGAEGTLRTTSPIARLVILPMSPLTFPVATSTGYVQGRARIPYSVTYGGVGPAPVADPCALSSSFCPRFTSASPGLSQGADQPEPIELTFTGNVGQIRVRGMGAISCGTKQLNGVYTGNYGSIVGYDATGRRVGSVALRLGHPLDCGADNITYGSLGTLNSSRPIARAVIMPMSPLTFPARDGSEMRASATYGLEYGVGSLRLPPPFSAPSSIVEGSGYSIALSGTVGALDGTLGLPDDGTSREYALDCGLGEGYTAWSRSVSSVVCPVQRDQRAVPITVRGKVRDASGAEREYTGQVAVTNAKPLVTFAATSATTINVGETVSFRGAFTDAGLDDGPWTWRVVWGDNTPSGKGLTSVQGDLGPITHTYATPGTYGAYLKVVDKDGTQNVVKKVTITVLQPAP